MAAFYRFQRVRIVLSENPDLAPLVGREATITGFETDAYLARMYGPIVLAVDGDPDEVCCAEGHIEPLRYLPSPEDFASIEGDLPRGPVRDPSLSPEAA